MKAIPENVDSSASGSVDPERVRIVLPDDFEPTPDGLHIRWPDRPLEQELRLQKYKLYAAIAFARANALNRIVIDSPKARFGIVSTGKSYLDVLQALDDLGIDADHAADIGLRVYKVGMSWPLEREGIRHFAEGLEEILVVEEKRAVMENQIKEQLYNWREDVRPRVIGKFDEDGEWILPSAGELTPARIARVIAGRIGRFYTSTEITDRLAFLEDKERSLEDRLPEIERIPYFCAGCPHNISTTVPEGSRVVAGIGCHYMAIWMDRDTATFTHMGGEGANWIGQAPFTETEHIFVNIGDGTYFHSGLLAIRAAVSAGVTMTYKILYNDAVAMTGGQPVDGPLSLPLITRPRRAESVARTSLVPDTPRQHPGAPRSERTIQRRYRCSRLHALHFSGADTRLVGPSQFRNSPANPIRPAAVVSASGRCCAKKHRSRLPNRRKTVPIPPRNDTSSSDVVQRCLNPRNRSFNQIPSAPARHSYGDGPKASRTFSMLFKIWPTRP